MSNTVKAAFQLAGAEVEQGDSYPAWKMNPDSKLTKIAVESYKKLFNKEPKVLGIHAGLECGLFSVRYPHLIWFHSVQLSKTFIHQMNVSIFLL
jgi:dipeptidase D